MASKIILNTELGNITLRLLPESAPQTVDYITTLAQSKLYDGASFYRSDFVIQFGLHGSNKTNPHGCLSVNETSQNTMISNTRGTAAIAHFDVPDCGGSEVFINLGDNPHLDTAYGGFCVFARVEEGNNSSFNTVDAIAAAVKQKGKVVIQNVSVQ